MDNLIGFLGYALQWLRAFSWFSEKLTVPFIAVSAFAATMFVAGVPLGPAFVPEFISNFLKIAGGLGLSILLSHANGPVALAPKYNSM